MRKGEPMGVCKALTITKILFWSRRVLFRSMLSYSQLSFHRERQP